MVALTGERHGEGLTASHRRIALSPCRFEFALERRPGTAWLHTPLIAGSVSICKDGYYVSTRH